MGDPYDNDVDLDMPRERKLPNERFDLLCGECQAPMVLRFSQKYEQHFYGCSRYPECPGTHGCHKDGRPNGIPANKATKKSRIKAHSVFDQLWRNDSPLGARRLRRRDAYTWLRKAMKLSNAEAHIGMFNSDQCEQLIHLVYQDYPKLRTRWSRLLYKEEDLDFGDLD